MLIRKVLFTLFFVVLTPLLLVAGNNIPPSIAGIRLEFILFGLTLTGVAVFHHKTFQVAIIGLIAILGFKFIFDPSFNLAEHLFGSSDFLSQILDKHQRQGEWSVLLNLLGLLLGFAILAKYFEETRIPDYLPKLLPDDWKGPFLLLIFVFILSSVLDNIAAAMIGGTIAMVVFNNKIHLGYLAALVAASNAGGAGSVLGDTTTTMMWIDGVHPWDVAHAYIAAGAAFLVFAWFGSRQQDKLQRIQMDPKPGIKIQYTPLFIVILILLFAIVSNFLFDLPAFGVWLAISLSTLFYKAPWKEVQKASKGTIFLICLVTSASLMPVNELPPASWVTTFILGFVSALFDNIPLTKLCLDQGCYDWGLLAYAVGFGGSMVWFGSSAGVAITNEFPEARNAVSWIKKGWHVVLAYIIGFVVLYFIMGWNPADTRRVKTGDCNHPKKTEILY